MKFIALITGLLIFSACSESSEDKEDNNDGKVNTEATPSKEENTAEDQQIEETNEVAEPDMEEAVEAETIVDQPLEVYLDDPDTNGTNVRDKPNGSVVMTLKIDEISIEYFLTVIDAKDGWFRLQSPISSMEEDFEFPGEAWIHGSVVAVDTRNYGGQEIKLYDGPGKDNQVVETITEELGGLKIKDLHGKWVLIEHNGVQGWVDGQWLCGNPLTTCS